MSSYSYLGEDFLKYLNKDSTPASYNSKKGYLGLLFKMCPELKAIKDILNNDIDSIFSINDKEKIIYCLDQLYAYVYYLSYANHKRLSDNQKNYLRKYASSGLKPYISWLETQTPSEKNSKSSWKSKWDKCLKNAFCNIKINGNDSLFAYSFVGMEEDKSNNDEMERKLILHAVKSSYFFDYESCKIENRHNEIIGVSSGIKCEGCLYENGIPYRESDRSKKGKTFKNANDQTYPVLPDNNGNLHVRTLIKEKTGYDLNPNDPDFVNFTISHIWENAPSPLFFTNLWNIVLVPTWINYLLDKKNQGPDSLATKMRDTFKAICVEQYRMKFLNWTDFPDEEKPEIENFPKKKAGEYIINVIKSPQKDEPMGRITTKNITI